MKLQGKKPNNSAKGWMLGVLQPTVHKTLYFKFRLTSFTEYQILIGLGAYL